MHFFVDKHTLVWGNVMGPHFAIFHHKLRSFNKTSGAETSSKEATNNDLLNTTYVFIKSSHITKKSRKINKYYSRIAKNGYGSSKFTHAHIVASADDHATNLRKKVQKTENTTVTPKIGSYI